MCARLANHEDGPLPSERTTGEPVTTEWKLPTLIEVQEAAAFVGRFLSPTPQYEWPILSQEAGCELWIKHENHTPTGSFKMRGGLVYLDWLRRSHPEVNEVVTATRGNHGQSIAFAAQRLGLRAVVVVPHGNSREKNAAMRALGAELIEHGHDFHDADAHADELSASRKVHRVLSFHPLLVRGVASYALELFQAVPQLDLVYVPIGWGSGAAGLAAVRNALGLKTKIIAVVSAEAPSYARSILAGRIVDISPRTRIADGIAVARPHRGAFELVRNEIERVVEVSDDRVEAAMRAYFRATHNVAEGAGAAALAAVFQECTQIGRRRVAAVLTGGNVDSDVYCRVLTNRSEGRTGSPDP
jgi:threonine dehydratase